MKCISQSIIEGDPWFHCGIHTAADTDRQSERDRECYPERQMERGLSAAYNARLSKVMAKNINSSAL